MKKPYVEIIESALKIVRAELKVTNLYARSEHIKLIKQGKDGTFPEYAFFHDGYEDKRRYMNMRLRNRTEELISVYFAMVGNSSKAVATTC